MTSWFRRKKYFVARGLQLRFTWFVVAFVLFFSVITGLTIFYTVFMILGEKLAAVYPQGRLVEIFRSVYGVMAIELLVILPIISYGSIVFSHRIAGPLPKIYQALKNIGQGQYEVNLILRKNDELRDLADAVNAMARDLRERQANKL